MTPPFQFYREITALRHLRRFPQNACVRPISVAEHSAFVGLLAFQFADELAQAGVPIDRNAACTAGLHHDLEEALTTDLPHQVKRSSLELYRAWEALEEEVRQEFAAIMAVPPPPEPQSLMALVIRVADWSELILYVCEEHLVGSRAVDAPAELILQGLKKLKVEQYTQALSAQDAKAVSGWLQETVDHLQQVYDGGAQTAAHRPLTEGRWGRASRFDEWGPLLLCPECNEAATRRAVTIEWHRAGHPA